jgi:hypothetical protein
MIDRVLKQVVCPTSESAREGRAYYIKAIRMRPCRRAGASFCRETPQKGHKVTDVRQDCLKQNEASESACPAGLPQNRTKLPAHSVPKMGFLMSFLRKTLCILRPACSTAISRTSYGRQDNLLLEFGQNEEIIPCRAIPGFWVKRSWLDRQSRANPTVAGPSLSFECRIRV